MAQSAMTTRGRITIPVEVRRAIGLEPGDCISFTVLPDGTTVMRAKTRSIQDLSGMLKGKSRKKVAIRDLRIGR